MTRAFAPVLAALAGLALVASSGAASEKKLKRPRIVSAAMADIDQDARADGMRLTYSQRVRHRADRDGRYPFAVSGYRIRSVGAASGRTLVIVLVEQAQPDPSARPSVRYRRTRSKPVTGLTKVEAAAQLFRATRPHGVTPPGVPPPPAPPTVLDADGDGTNDSQDCAPQNKDVHPGAADVPDLAFVDSNCDGIDGTEKNAIFASPKGSDANPGTKQRPKRQIQAAVQAAAGKNMYVLATGGNYTRVALASGVSVYGGYDADRWTRSTGIFTQISGSPEGVFANGAKNVTLQLLTVEGTTGATPGDNTYGIRAINGSSLVVERVTARAGDGVAGPPGATGGEGLPGSPGASGRRGADDSSINAFGGAGGASPAGRNGGNGGRGRYAADGVAGEPGLIDTPGGSGGALSHGYYAESGANGRKGQNGTSGGPGALGAGGSNASTLAGAEYVGQNGSGGATGAPGNGGGGGGGGGGQTGYLVLDGTGAGGSGGGGGGAGGGGGGGGGAGGGSFGVYLYNSSLVVRDSTISTGSGGPGGRGGNGGPGGKGGAGGPSEGLSIEVGDGGEGGRGGDGGRGGGGGGGAGGPSVGIFKAGTATARVTTTDVRFGTGGAGGASGASSSIFANPFPAQAGIAQAIYP